MKLKVFDKSSLFFGRSIALTPTTTEEEYKAHNAVWTIQRWWKQLYLKKTAIESAHYLHDVVSLEQARHESFTELERFLLNPKTQLLTRQLLTHLEETKDVILADRPTLPQMKHGERQFLTAYMIVTQSNVLFESPTEVDSLLLECAEQMLESFEALCAFMGEIYLGGREHATSPLGERTPAADLVLAHIEGNEWAAHIRHDHRFVEAGKDLLEIFHLNQITYYETFAWWEARNRSKITQLLITHYLKLESKCFTLLHSLDPRMIELYEGYCAQQKTLKGKIKALMHEEGIRLLDEALAGLHDYLEANKWLTSPVELLTHEIALNPDFQLTEEACIIHPELDVDAAISALEHEAPDTRLLVCVLEEIGEKLAVFTPHNRRQIARLQELFSREALQKELDTAGLEHGLYRIIAAFLEQIKNLESEVHVPETDAFLDFLAFNVTEYGGSGLLLKESIDLIYRKMSQILLEVNNYKIHHAASLINRNIVTMERKYFDDRIKGKQFDLGFVLEWMNRFISAPEDYRLNLDLFCSKYVGTYVAHALLVNTLQEPTPSIMKTIPETFYLDRLRLIDWHARFQKILYLTAALGYIETCCKDHGVTLSHEELQEEKINLVTFLATESVLTAKEKAAHCTALINRLLIDKGRMFAGHEEEALLRLLESVASGSHPINKLLTRRLGDHLSSYLFRGRPPEAVHAVIKRYQLEEALNELGTEILPVIRLHTKVYSSFYQQQIEQKLWKPIFVVLKEEQLPRELPDLFASEEDALRKTHHKLHKLAFVLTGLALIQQTVSCSDMWHHKIVKGSVLKIHAESLGLLAMINNEEVSKEMIQDKLMALARLVTAEEEVALDEGELLRMLQRAKTEHSPGCKAFLTELTSLCKQEVLAINGLPANPKNLLAEFKEEIDCINVEVKKLLQRAKEERLGSDLCPVAPTIPLLHTGLSIEERLRVIHGR